MNRSNSALRSDPALLRLPAAASARPALPARLDGREQAVTTALPHAPRPAYGPEAGDGRALQYHARIVMRDGQRYGVLTADGAVWTTAAAGCFLRPEIGDLALVSAASGQGYILAVLERGTPGSAARVEMPGDLQLSLPHGRLQVQAAAGVSVDAGPSMELAAGHASAGFGQLDVSCETLRVGGSTLEATWDTRTDVSGTRLDIATRSETHLGQSVRRVAGHDDVSAGSLRQSVKEDWSVQAATADVKATDRVAVDGGVVQIG